MKIKNLLINKLSLYILLGSLVGISSEKIFSEEKLIFTEHTIELTSNDLENYIKTSNSLSIEEKEYLYNSDFFKDVLSTINTSEYMKREYLRRFMNIDIKSFAYDNIRNGFYNPNEPNCLYVAEYNDLNTSTKDTIAHEFVHLCQYHPSKYNFLIEATAEIISNEYFNSTSINAYLEEVKSLKVLMEIIGPEPIWNYVFTGDFSAIKKQVKPYLKDNEYKDFLLCLQIDTEDNISRAIHTKRLNEILDILYFNKNNIDIKNDLVISLTRYKQEVIVRNYFNQRIIDQSHSYYYNLKSDCITLEEADKEGHILFYENNNRISFQEYCSHVGNPNFSFLTFYGEIKDNKFYYDSAEKIYLPTINERFKGKQKTQ